MQNFKIHLKMHIIQGFERSKTAYEVDAKFVKKDGKFFLLFDEENYDDDTVTKCRFEISEDSLRMRRNGSIVMEQIHVRDQKTEGYIKTPFGHVNTKLQTFQLALVMQDNGQYYLDLGYDLYIEDQKTGTYLLEITIVKKEEVIS